MMKNRKKRVGLGVLLLSAAALACCSAESEVQEILETEENEVYFTIEGYGQMLQIRQTDLDGQEYEEETMSIDFGGLKGKTVREILEDMDYISVTPVETDDVFEGWMEYKMIITEGDDGFDLYEYEKLSDELCTTEEMMEKEISEDHLMFVAKWQSIPEEDYFAEEESMWTSESFAFALEANGGILTFDLGDDEKYESGCYTYWMETGEELQAYISGENEFYDALLSVEKEDATLTGWTVYEADSVTWSAEPSEEEGVLSIPTSMEEEGFEYILLENGAEYAIVDTTEELGAIVCADKNYCAVANWES